MHADRRRAGSAAAVAGTVMLLATACAGPPAPADGATGNSSPGASTPATRTPSAPAAVKSPPNPGFAAFRAQPCPQLTDVEKTRGDLITMAVGPREDLTVHPGGEPQTVLVKLCNTTGETLPDIALSAQVEGGGERSPQLTVERREAPDGDWHPVELRVANDYNPRMGASGAWNLPARGTRIVEYRISAAEGAPAGRGPFMVYSVRAGADLLDMESMRGGGHGAFQLTIAPRE